MIVNEVLQWAAIGVLAVFVLGLTRQLGMFIVPRVEQLETEGPAIGKRLSTALIGRDDATRFADVMEREQAKGLAVVILDHACATCQGLIRSIRETTGPSPATQILGLPSVAVVKSSPASFEAEARAAFPFIITDRDGSACAAAGIYATPFAVLLDREMRVRDRRVSANVPALAHRWSAMLAEVGHEHSAQDADHGEAEVAAAFVHTNE
jgi:hypothetical protein